MSSAFLLQLSVYFRLARTQFLARDWVTLIYTPAISQSPCPLGAGRTRTAEIRESILTVLFLQKLFTFKISIV